MIKNHGLVISKVEDPEAYKRTILGGRLPEIVLVEDGQWDNFLPVYEGQALGYETHSCTAYGSLNAVEMYLKRLNNTEENFSDRFIYNVAEINPPGADPHYVLEKIRNVGVIPEKDLPRPSTLKEFRTPRPMDSDLLDKALEFPWEVKHEYVKWTDLDSKKRIIKNTLRFSPLMVSVTAWNLRDGVYVDNGQPNNHWCVLYGWNAKGWKIFDTYDGGLKTASWDHNFEVCKRIYLEKNNRLPKISLYTRIINLLKEMLGLIQDTPEAQNKPVKPTQPLTEPVGSRLIEFATAIRDFEGRPGDLNYRNNNPGNIKGTNGKFLKFKTWEEGWKYLLNYIERVASGKHKAYPKGGDTTILQFFRTYAPSSDNNSPDIYAKFVAKRLDLSTSTKIKDLV